MDWYRKSPALTASCWMGIGEKSWLEIFKRLPAETLCLCRIVCKEWNSVISSASFIRYHHSFTALSTPPHQKTYLRFPIIQGSSSTDNPYSLHFPSPQDPDTILDSNLHFPFRFLGDVKARHEMHFPNFRSRNNIPSVKFDCVDVVHGIVCLSYSLDSSFDSIILWNPAIHKFVSLPYLPYDPSPLPQTDTFLASRARWFSHLIGFGYDGYDFKVVRIWIPNSSIQITYGSILPTCEVYSAAHCLWESVNLGPDNIIQSCQFSSRFDAYSRISCFVNSTLHWLVSVIHNPSRLSVLMFDCEPQVLRATELPQEMLTPEQRDGMVLIRPMLLEYAGKLSALLQFSYSPRIPSRGDLVELWIMQKHGVATSWEMVHSFRDYIDVPIYPPSFLDLAPYCNHQYRSYQESLFLMDDRNAQSYSKHGMVDIDLSTYPIGAPFRINRPVCLKANE